MDKTKTYEFKFAIGDTAYRVFKQQVKIHIKCEYCLGNGKMQYGNGQYTSCNKCYGKGGSTTYEPDAIWQVDHKKLTIGQQRVEISEKEIKEQYMCNESGIGSGTVYYAKDLFPSISECNDWCKAQNIGDKLDVLMEKEENK